MRKGGRNHRGSINAAVRARGLERLEDRRLLSVAGPDAFGYRAETYVFEAIDLVPGGEGVTPLLQDADDGTAAIDLGSNNFTFYGTTYSAQDLWASSNGLITVGPSSATDFNNSLQFGSPLPAIAPLWDDWATFKNNTLDAADDQVLYKIETVDGHTRLVVEWNEVYAFNSRGNFALGDSITFQAILELNTGPESGAIVFNYVDLDTDVSPNGAGASVGVKNAGNGIEVDPVRLVISEDRFVDPVVGSGRAFIVERNHRPVLTAPSPVSVEEGGQVTLAATATDEDPGDTLVFSWDMDNNGTFETSGPSVLFSAAGLSDPAQRTVAVRVTDGRLGHDEVRQVVIDVVNASPLAAADLLAATEDTPLVINPGMLLGNDSDPGGDPLSLVSVTQPQHGALTPNADGSYTYVPAADFFGTDSFTYEISDGQGGTSSATVTVEVAGVNDAPVATADAVSTDEDTTLSGNVLANDQDAEGDTLHARLDTAPLRGSLTLNDDGSFQYVPVPNEFGTYRFTYVAFDDAGAESGVTEAVITVRPVNDAPVATGESATVANNATLSGNVLVNDTDVDGDPLEARVVRSTAHGTLSLTPDGRFTYTPDAGFVGSDSFRYEVDDLHGGLAQAELTIEVTAQPDPEPEPDPVVQLIPDATQPGLMALVVNGTADSELIAVLHACDGLEVYFGFESMGVFPATGRVIVYGNAGNDLLLIGPGVLNQAWLYGGDGNDALKLGHGGGIAFGGLGSDALVGGNQRDILVGGEGSDLLVGNPGDDILISAMTVFDNRANPVHEEAWAGVYAEWNSSRAFAERVNNLRDGTGPADRLNGSYFLNDGTIEDDLAADAIDILVGSSGTDWYIYRFGEDLVLGLSKTEGQYDLGIA